MAAATAKQCEAAMLNRVCIFSLGLPEKLLTKGGFGLHLREMYPSWDPSLQPTSRVRVVTTHILAGAVIKQSQAPRRPTHVPAAATESRSRPMPACRPHLRPRTEPAVICECISVIGAAWGTFILTGPSSCYTHLWVAARNRVHDRVRCHLWEDSK